MACRPPMRPKSTPYWKGERIITPQARKTFQWARHPSPFCVAVMVSCNKTGDVVPVATSRDVPVQKRSVNAGHGVFTCFADSVLARLEESGAPDKGEGNGCSDPAKLGADQLLAASGIGRRGVWGRPTGRWITYDINQGILVTGVSRCTRQVCAVRDGYIGLRRRTLRSDGLRNEVELPIGGDHVASAVWHGVAWGSCVLVLSWGRLVCYLRVRIS